MFKNQLQELAQRSCFNLPSYSCIREGPDHAPRFKATVNFNGETFESPSFCSTLRQAEHAAAEVALGTLAESGPSKTLAARVLDETGVYKNLLQETAHRAGLNLPVYTTFRTGQGQVPIFSCTVELAGMSFSGKPARTKKLAQKNAAMAAWSALRTLSQQDSSSSTSSSSSSPGSRCGEEQEQVIIARALSRLQPSNLKELNQSLRSPHSYSESTNLRHQNFLLSGLSPEINLYQLWQQNYLLQQQYCLLGFTLSPPIPPPRNYPIMQPLSRPYHSVHFPILQESMPVPLLPKMLVSSSDLTSSVTIQEIREEKPEESSEQKREQSFQKNDQQEKDEVQRKTGNVQLQSTQAELHQWLRLPAHGSSNFKSKPIDFRLATPFRPGSSSHVGRSDPEPVVIRNRSSTSLVTRRPSNPTSMEALTRLKPGPFSHSPRYGYENHDRVAMRPASMAPPVRVRSVVRVCSAPPLRKTPGESTKEQRKN